MTLFYVSMGFVNNVQKAHSVTLEYKSFFLVGG